MKLTRIGHACVLLEGGKNILIDPFITDNPASKHTLEDLPKLDYILVSHDHFDHFGTDAIELAKRDGAKLVAVHEITVKPEVADSGIEAVGMNIGGTYSEEGVDVALTNAVHSSDDGDPTGIVVTIDGVRVYHAGDTDLFSDMSLISDLHGDIDVALLPIGGHYTMDEQGAAKAASLIAPGLVVPIHYDTFPPIEADTEYFSKLCGDLNIEVEIVDPAESIDIS